MVEKPSHFLQLWSHDTARQNLRQGRLLDHTASAFASGSTVWAFAPNVP